MLIFVNFIFFVVAKEICLSQFSWGNEIALHPLNYQHLRYYRAKQISPTVMGVWTSFKVQTGPYGYCVACPGRVLIKSASWGRRQKEASAGVCRPKSISVIIGRFNSYVESTNKLRRNWREIGKMGYKYVHHCELAVIRCNADILMSVEG